jgi:alpha-D-xyloside xylohydrolase
LLCGGRADVGQWSYREDVYKICEKYVRIRETLRDYTRELMRAAHERGCPVIRPLFYQFPRDPTAWEIEDQYLYGDKYICCPVLCPNRRKQRVYLPKGADWRSWDGKEAHEGGKELEVDCPMDFMPVFIREKSGTLFLD